MSNRDIDLDALFGDYFGGRIRSTPTPTKTPVAQLPAAKPAAPNRERDLPQERTERPQRPQRPNVDHRSIDISNDPFGGNNE